MFWRTFALSLLLTNTVANATNPARERIRLLDGWRFKRFEKSPDNLIYDLRPDRNGPDLLSLKPWILPSANDYIKDPASRHQEPEHQLDANIPFTEEHFDDSDWDMVTVPHDWAITRPSQNDSFLGSMGSLLVYGVGWYRHDLNITGRDKARHIYLGIDGAMSYSMVWLNNALVGGWPFGYASFRLDLTPFVRHGKRNILAVRTENPWDTFSRWCPGAGLFRNVWAMKTGPIHIEHWGAHVTSRNVSSHSATLELVVDIECKVSNVTNNVDVATDIYKLNATTGEVITKVGQFPANKLSVVPGKRNSLKSSLILERPRLWGPLPFQTPNLYGAITRILLKNQTIDEYEMTFGIRSLQFTPENGLLVNDERFYIQGVNMHHDFGTLGAAYNHQAAERQLQMLQEMGVKAIRTSLNPPAPEILELTDRMGFLVLHEAFDVWEQSKSPVDTHLIFPDWHEPDLRAFLRGDRNHPSVFMWSFGNEVPEQQSTRGAEIATLLGNIVKEKDCTRMSTCSMNLARPDQSLPEVLDAIALNYQGEEIRHGPGYNHLTGNHRAPQYDVFHKKFPEKYIFGSEVAWSLSHRGSFFFPPTHLTSAPANDTNGGGNSTIKQVSAYELYSSQAGSSPERVFSTQNSHPFVEVASSG